MAKVRSGSNTPDDRLISFKIGDKVYSETIDGNIELSELTPDQMMNSLNRAVGKYAYYGSIRADAKRLQSKISSEFEAWKAVKMNSIMVLPEFAKETAKKIEIKMMIDNQEAYSSYERQSRDIDMICDKLLVLQNAFELMTKTLQSCLAMLRTELEHSGRGGFARGSGDLNEEA